MPKILPLLSYSVGLLIKGASSLAGSPGNSRLDNAILVTGMVACTVFMIRKARQESVSTLEMCCDP